MSRGLRAVALTSSVEIGGATYPADTTLVLPEALTNILIHRQIASATEFTEGAAIFPDADQFVDVKAGETIILPGAAAGYRPSSIESPVDHRIEFLSQQIGAFEAKLNAAVQTAISDNLRERREQITAADDALRTQLTEVEEIRASVSAAIDKTMEGQKVLSRRVSERAGDLLAERYELRANSQARKIILWQLLTLGSILAWGGFIMWRITSLGDGSAETAATQLMSLAINLDWPGSAMLAAQNAPFVACASFAAIQVSRHHSAEQIFRKLSLELNLIDQYVDSLPTSEQHEIKKKFADRFFLGSEGDASRS